MWNENGTGRFVLLLFFVDLCTFVDVCVCVWSVLESTNTCWPCKLKLNFKNDDWRTNEQRHKITNKFTEFFLNFFFSFSFVSEIVKALLDYKWALNQSLSKEMNRKPNTSVCVFVSTNSRHSEYIVYARHANGISFHRTFNLFSASLSDNKQQSSGEKKNLLYILFVDSTNIWREMRRVLNETTRHIKMSNENSTNYEKIEMN